VTHLLEGSSDGARHRAVSHHEPRSGIAMDPILIATSNPGKLSDFTGAAAAFGVQVAALPGLADLPEVAEDGDSFAANARKKAAFYSRHARGSLVLADDSGLEVPALNNRPGVRSARYAADLPHPGDSELSADEANNRRLLRELAAVPEAERKARFVCVLALARNGEIIRTFSGEIHGKILHAPRGTHGFGYDPLFFVPELGQTTAELTPEKKALVSHRGAAFKEFLEWYRQEPSA